MVLSLINKIFLIVTIIIFISYLTLSFLYHKKTTLGSHIKIHRINISDLMTQLKYKGNGYV